MAIPHTFRGYKEKLADTDALREKYLEKLKQMDETYAEMVRMRDSMPDDVEQVGRTCQMTWNR